MPRPDDQTHEDTSLRDAMSVLERLEEELHLNGASPIESCLAKVALADRPAVLCVLVSLELAARRGRGESPLETEYLLRFPGQAAIIRAAFFRFRSETEGTRIAHESTSRDGMAHGSKSPAHDMSDAIPPAGLETTARDVATVTHHSALAMDATARPVQQNARYSLSHFHKAGGLGEVWRARDHQLGREVALKRLKEDCVNHPSIRARFLREAWITGQLQHPGIVPVFELGSLADFDGPFYTMRFVEGPTFSAAVAEFHRKRTEGTTGPLDLRQLLGSFVSACQVVAYAHSRKVIHRDLKGDNIVLGDFGEVIVLDWGIAKVVGQTGERADEKTGAASPMGVEPPDGRWAETIDGSIMGTPAYMAPEQALGHVDELDERSDVYGLGAILYEILTGEPPFRGKSEEVLQRVVAESPIQPRHKVHDAPEALEAICLKCLAKNPLDRYPSALALAEDIERFLAGEPVSVHRETWRARARRWAARHRTFVTATAATLLVATACLAVATALLRIANGREAAARSQAEKHLFLTLQAVDSFFTHVADAPSLKTFGLEKFQREVLTEAEKVIKQLVNVQTRASDVSAEHGRCCLRLSLITGMLGDPGASIPYAMEARAIFAKLAESDSGRTAEHQRGLAESLDALGLAYEGVYRLADAEATHEQAARAWEGLATAPGAAPELVYRLAAALYRRSRLLCLKLSDALGALKVLAVSREYCDQLVRQHPESADYLRTRAKVLVLTGVAMSYAANKNVNDATILFEEALPVLEKLAADQPGNTEVQADLVDACAMIAAAYSNARLVGRITTIYEQVRNNAKRLVKEHPDVPSFAENNALIETLHSMRIALSGDHVQAVGLLNEALRGAGKSGLARLFAACCFSVASDVAARDPALANDDRATLVEGYQNRAVKLLREAKDTGLFLQPNQLEGVRSKDDDLKSLRKRADFQAFLSELEQEISSHSRPQSGDTRSTPPRD